MNKLETLLQDWRERAGEDRKRALKPEVGPLTKAGLTMRKLVLIECANELEKVLDTRVKDND